MRGGGGTRAGVPRGSAEPSREAGADLSGSVQEPVRRKHAAFSPTDLRAYGADFIAQVTPSDSTVHLRRSRCCVLFCTAVSLKKKKKKKEAP